MPEPPELVPTDAATTSAASRELAACAASGRLASVFEEEGDVACVAQPESIMEDAPNVSAAIKANRLFRKAPLFQKVWSNDRF
jgi:hypothetical protein